MAERILIIKLSALGDFVQSMTAMQAVRAHYPTAHITLLTTPPYEALAKASGLFDVVQFDPRPKLWQRGKINELKSILNADYRVIVDLQTNDRTRMYYSWLKDPRPDWCGHVPGAKYPHATPWKDNLHTLERQREQLAVAGIPRVEFDDLSWARADLTKFDLPERYALLVPGGSAHRPQKRWPAPRFGLIATHLAEQGITPLVLGHGKEEQALAKEIAVREPKTRSLVGQTDFLEIISLGRGAQVAIGNDTGPMHLVAPTGCPSVVLFSGASSPALCRPRGADVAVLQRDDLQELPYEAVIQALP